MRRFLNEAQQVNIVPFDGGYELKFRLGDGYTAVENEVVTGEYSGKRYFFIYKDGHLYSISHDDFTYDFLRLEESDLSTNFNSLSDIIGTLGVTAQIITDDILDDDIPITGGS